jgi:four helix bundle protein
MRDETAGGSRALSVRDEAIQRMKDRTLQFALSVVKLTQNLPRSMEGQVLGRQLLRSGTSVGAHYREAIRSKSDPDFISKIEGALQELEETGYWLELLRAAGVLSPESIQSLMRETDELTAMFVTIVKKVKARRQA